MTMTATARLWVQAPAELAARVRARAKEWASNRTWVDPRTLLPEAPVRFYNLEADQEFMTWADVNASVAAAKLDVAMRGWKPKDGTHYNRIGTAEDGLGVSYRRHYER